MVDTRLPFPLNLRGHLFADGWTIEDTIGEGATSVVFRATRGHEEAAIKVLNPAFVRSEKAELERIERQLKLKGHNHPSLVRIISGGRQKKLGYMYVVMEYVRGKTLDAARRNIPVYRIKPLLAQIADAARYLEEYYENVHRDIKPTNVIDVDDEHRRVKLVDLGIMRPIYEHTEATTPPGAFIGTYRYSPPEAVQEKKIPPEAFKALTFYQLGGIAHDLITGKRLFGNLDPDTTRQQLIDIISNDPIELSNLRPHVDPELVELTRKCMEKKWEVRVDIVSWDDFERPLFRRRPVVVLLYTGGTIGAVASDEDEDIRALRTVESLDDKLLHTFKRRLRADYNQLAGPDAQMPFELEWDYLPREQQLLSENARYKSWENLGRAIENICAKYAPPRKTDPDLKQDYLAGIVVLHGTDTLAYSAAALSLSLRNLPCPVILTGSNQPPNEQDLHENRLITSTSDAWENVHRSLEFIETFGHRFTEVFVCFNDTVHVAVNLRKSAIDRMPHRRERDALEEPYFYRNRGPVRQYAFKNIDGLYCNNLYPLSASLTYQDLVDDKKNEYRHVRRSPWFPEKAVERASFSGRVRLLLASPLALLPESGRRLKFWERLSKRWKKNSEEDSEDVQVLLLEGYGSGTFPTHPDHPFHAQLKALLRDAVPVVLVSRNGLIPSKHQYEMERIAGVDLPVLRLFGVIAETATPLISVVLAGITEEEWNEHSKNPNELLRERHKLLRKRIRQLVDSGGIFKAILGDVIKEGEQHNARVGDFGHRELIHNTLVKSLFDDAKDRVRKDWQALERLGKKRFHPNLMFLSRPHFLWMFAQIVHSYESANAGPDGLAFLNQLGFDWGSEVRIALLTSAPRCEMLFAEQGAGKQSELKERAVAQLDEIKRYLIAHGVVHITHHQLSIDPQQLLLEVKAKKHSHGGRDDEIFAALGHREVEEEFFRLLQKGGETTMDAGECKEFVEKSYYDLFNQPFEKKVSPLDWFLLGTFKALACGWLRDLRFDSWIDQCNSATPVAIEPIRQSIHTDIVAADPTVFHLKLRYTARRPLD
jgi:serine/threonine protein kinase